MEELNKEELIKRLDRALKKSGLQNRLQKNVYPDLIDGFMIFLRDIAGIPEEPVDTSAVDKLKAEIAKLQKELEEAKPRPPIPVQSS